MSLFVLVENNHSLVLLKHLGVFFFVQGVDVAVQLHLLGHQSSRQLFLQFAHSL